MRLKSFYGTNMTEAMSQVRAALGDEAIIIATRDDEMGGVRVTAAIDEPIDIEQPVEYPNEMQDMDVEDASEASLEVIASALTQHRVPAPLAEKIMASATQFADEDPILALGAALDIHLNFDQISLDKDKRSIALIGPPGAGKTLCTAKLATQATLAGKPLTVISTDTERAGGMAQLAAFTRILECNMMEIEDAHALEDALSIQKPETMVIVDTAGCNPFNEIETQNLKEILKAAKAEPVIVMPSDIDALEATDMACVFKDLGARQMISTRLDMTRRLGGLLHLANETKLTLCNYCASSKISEQPQPLNPVSLGRLILPQGIEEEQKATGTYE